MKNTPFFRDGALFGMRLAVNRKTFRRSSRRNGMLNAR